MSVSNDFYPRSPCGERPWQRGSRITYVEISIHALLAESDVFSSGAKADSPTFLSTLSLRRATIQNTGACLNILISIHALLAESDRCHRLSCTCRLGSFLSTLSLRRATTRPRNSRSVFRHFYPRSPCGERLWVLRKVPILGIFLSTLSLRRATLAVQLGCRISLFLSTLSLRRATLATRKSCDVRGNFYPRSPCGERRCLRCCAISCITISIHALLAESDPKYHRILLRHNAFLSTLSLRRATSHRLKRCLSMSSFLSTLSLRRATREPTALRTPHHIFLSTLSLRRATLADGRENLS